MQAAGNLVTILFQLIIDAVDFKNAAVQFFTYAALMFLCILAFFPMTMRYRYVSYDENGVKTEVETSQVRVVNE